MTTQEMILRINAEIAPDKMGKEEAFEWLVDLKSLIDAELDALDAEISEEDGL